ncbi:MAG TPA: hypothetical protein VII56_10670 [Rhizomicrobium sp.]
MGSDFSFLDEYGPALRQKLEQAEEVVDKHPDLSLTAIRTFCEWLLDTIAASNNVGKRGDDESFGTFTQRLSAGGLIPSHEAGIFRSIRKSANPATHDMNAEVFRARQKLFEAKALAHWFNHARPKTSVQLKTLVESGPKRAQELAHPEMNVPSQAHDDGPKKNVLHNATDDPLKAVNPEVTRQQSSDSPTITIAPISTISRIPTNVGETTHSSEISETRIGGRGFVKRRKRGNEVRAIRDLLRHNYGARVVQRIWKRYRVGVRRMGDDGLYFEGPDEQAVALAELALRREIHSTWTKIKRFFLY